MNAKPVAVDPEVLTNVAHGRYFDPHSVLGTHIGEDSVTIRTVAHLADAVEIVTSSGTYPATHEQDGIWVAVLEGTDIPDYRVRTTYGEDTKETDDGYRYLPTVGELDLHLIGEGRHEKLWDALGAHLRTYDTEMGQTKGASFAV